jgi:NTP pyrophosphatase (non-canonical NTP hydrolase)
MTTETQAMIGAWAKRTFPGGDDLSPRHCLRLLEEVIELCLAAGAKHTDVMRTTAAQLEKAGAVMSLLGGLLDVSDSPDLDKVPEEMADCEIVLRVLAQRRGVDLQAEVDRKMAVNRSRRWAVDGDGTGYHVKEGDAMTLKELAAIGREMRAAQVEYFARRNPNLVKHCKDLERRFDRALDEVSRGPGLFDGDEREVPRG